MPTIPELAPDLIAAGFTARELRRELRPRETAPAAPAPTIAPKRWKMAFRLVLKGRSDEEIMRLACVPIEVVNKVRAQVAAVRAKLAALEPVAYDAPEAPVPGDPDYVPPPPAPEPPAEPTPVPGDGGLN